MASSPTEYSVLNKDAGEVSGNGGLISKHTVDATTEDALLDDEVQVNVNAESDDDNDNDEFMQAGLDDSYRPPKAASSSGRSTRSTLVVGVLLTAILVMLLVLTASIIMYGNALLSNIRAARETWSINALSADRDRRAAYDNRTPLFALDDEPHIQIGDSGTPVVDINQPIDSVASPTDDDADDDVPLAAPTASARPPLTDKTAKPALLAHLASYIDRHYSPDMTLDPTRKYIVFTPTDDGLGNKLLPLISSFFLALILDRTWLIHWVGTEAINNSKVKVEEIFKAPDGMEWNWGSIVERTKAKQANNPKTADIGDQTVLFRTELCNVAGILGLSCSIIDMAGAGDEHAVDKTGLSCEDWRTEGRAADNVLVNWGDQYFVPSIQVNSAYRSFIEEMFDEDDIFGPLARFLLRPSDSINVYIQDMQQRFWTDRYVVSMQIRRRERLGLKGPEVDTAIKCAKRLAVAGKKETGKEVTFFVASDDEALRNDLVGRMQPEGQVVHVSNFTVREQQLGVFFAAIDIMLLSRGDAIVTTPSSTFGYSSAGFGSLIPNRVQLMPETDCTVAVNSEPSSHFFHAMVEYSQKHTFCVDFTKFDHLMAQEGCCPRW